MKKIIALLTVLALCLGVAGCNSNSGGDVPISEEDDGYIDMGGEVNNNDPAMDSGDTEKEGSWAKRIPGEYTGVSILKGMEIPENFVLNANKTCTIWGKNYTWKLQESNETNAIVEVFDGKTLVYTIHFNLNEEGYSVAHIRSEMEDNKDILKISFLNLSEFHVIKLTPENWQDYFEPVEECRFWHDESGKLSHMTIYTYYLLKEEYRNVCEEFSRNIRMNYDIRLIDRMITVDTENETYQWGDITDDRYDSYPDTSVIGNINWEGVITIPFGFSVSETNVRKFPTDEVTYRVYEPTKFSGTIYSMKAK